MANELHAHAPAGLTLYAVLLNSFGQTWNGSAWGTISGANWANYDIAMTEAAAGIYLATMPAVVAGVYSYAVYERDGVSPATTDTLRGIGSLVWDGSAEVSPASATAIAALQSDVDAIKLITDQLDVSAVTQVAASNAGHLTITAGLTFEESVTGLTIPADWVLAIWTLKGNVRDADTAALVQLRTSNPAAGTDGLQRLNGAAPAAPITAEDGELTVNQAGAITVYLTDELTELLTAAVDLGWDVKFIDASGDSGGQRGTADVVLTETRATT